MTSKKIIELSGRGQAELRRTEPIRAANHLDDASSDWVSGARSYVLGWGFPLGAMIAGLLVDVRIRAAIWAVALLWMGVACILNARRCGRTHCRYTGPYYLVMIIPTLVLGLGPISLSLYGWVALAAVIIFGSRLVWWATERAWGKFS